MNFQAAYETWIQQQSEKGSPERRRKLRSGLGFAEHAFLEHVWWPTVGNFTNLHPEYEVADYSGAPRFLDFAYLRGGLKLAIEIDGYTIARQESQPPTIRLPTSPAEHADSGRMGHSSFCLR